MPITNFSDSKLLKLSKTLTKDQAFTDSSGMTVSFRVGSKKTTVHFYMRKVVDGKRVRVKIGEFPFVTLAEARSEYIKLVANADRGLPLEQLKEKIITFDQLWQEFCGVTLKDTAQNTKRTYISIYKNHFAKYAQKDIKSFDKKFVRENILQRLLDEDKNAAAIRVSTILYRMYEYAESLDYVPSNPLEKLTKTLPKNKTKHHPAFKLEESKEKMIQLFDAFAKYDRRVQALLHFYFYTLLRCEEVLNLKISEIKGDNFQLFNKTWKDVPYKVALSTQAQALIKYMIDHHINSNSPYLFEGNGANCKRSALVLQNALKDSGFYDQLHVHGIRTVGFQWLRDQPDIKEMTARLCIAHKSGLGDASDQSYNGTSFFNLRKQAMQKWSDFVESCIGKNRFY